MKADERGKAWNWNSVSTTNTPGVILQLVRHSAMTSTTSTSSIRGLTLRLPISVTTSTTGSTAMGVTTTRCVGGAAVMMLCYEARHTADG